MVDDVVGHDCERDGREDEVQLDREKEGSTEGGDSHPRPYSALVGWSTHGAYRDDQHHVS